VLELSLIGLTEPNKASDSRGSSSEKLDGLPHSRFYSLDQEREHCYEGTEPEEPVSDILLVHARPVQRQRDQAEGNDEFVQTLNGLMDRLKDYHNTVVTEWGAGQDNLIRGSEEDRRVPPVQEPQHDALPQERSELLSWLYSAQNEEQIDEAVAAVDHWLVERPHDEEVRLAREQAIQRRPGAPPH
jgi:hypothetical protein